MSEEILGAAVAEWLISWLAEQEDRGSIPGLASWIFRDWLSPASKSRYGWKIAKSTLILKTTNQPTNQRKFERNKGTINFTLSFMTNVTISISTLQIFSSWVAIFQPRPPLLRSLYDMPGLALRMDVLFWGRRDFQISISNRDTSRNAWNRHWGSFMVDTGILSNNMKFPSHKC